jgi:hypothetical protein
MKLCARVLRGMIWTSRFAAVRFVSMSVRHVTFTTIEDFTRSINEALDQGQEPTLNIATAPFYQGMQKFAFQKLNMDGEHAVHITMDDADWNQPHDCDHQVVISSGSLKNGKIIIKDSNYNKTWSVESIDVLIPPQARRPSVSKVQKLLCKCMPLPLTQAPG